MADEADDILEEAIEDEAPTDQLKKLREKLKTCQREKQEYLDGWQRANADYANAVRSREAASLAAREQGAADLLASLLPALDSFDRATELAADSAGVADGLAQLHKQLVDELAAAGVVRIDQVDVPFDPAIHESVATEPVDDAKRDQHVVAVLAPGYQIGEQVVRPARVRIGVFEN